MRKTIWLLVLISGILYISNLPILAHTLKVQNEVGVSLHIDPDDDPIAGQEAVFYPKITDKTNLFKISDCDCRVQISQNGEVLFQTVLITDPSESNGKDAVFRYTFPAKGNYLLEMSGSSFTKSFNNFQIKYDLNVTKQSTPAPIETKKETSISDQNSQIESTPNSSMSLVEYAIFGAGLTIILVIALMVYVNRRRRQL
jgi:hypothetical protein